MGNDGDKLLDHGIYPHFSKMFNVSPETIRDIWRRRTYKWLPRSNIYTISLRHRRQQL